jgi:uncharacterized protein YfdQ (DUF2303 family)
MSQQVDNTAISQIRDMVLSQFIEEKLAGADCPAIVLPKDVSVESIERLHTERFRFRGKLDTSSIEDFVRYSTGYAAEGTRCFISTDKMSASSVFNLGTITNPGHADNKAVLTLKRTAPFTALLAINSDRNDQKTLAEWLEDWSDFVTGFDADGAVIDAKNQRRRFARSPLKQSRALSTKIRISAVAVQLWKALKPEPKTLCLWPLNSSVPYEGLAERRFKVRMSILASNQPLLVLRITQLEAYEEEMAVEFRDLLVEKFTDSKVETYIGVFNA